MLSTENVKTSIDQTYCAIIPKNFSTIYLFWKLSNFKIDKFISKEYNEKIIIKVFDEFENFIMETNAFWNSGRIYINLPKDNFKCKVKIYAQLKSGNLEEIASSNLIDIPSEKEYNLTYQTYKFTNKL